MKNANATTAATLEAIAARAGVNAGTLKSLCEGDTRETHGRCESVWSFLWRTEPGTIALMVDPIGGLAEANGKARKRAKRAGRGAELSIVPGVGGVWLVPEPVLETLFPVADGLP